MARKRFPPDDPREWLMRARSNLAHGRAVILEVCLEDLCFDAQQAAEKAIKAVWIHRGVRFPYVHNLPRSNPGNIVARFASPRPSCAGPRGKSQNHDPQGALSD